MSAVMLTVWLTSQLQMFSVIYSLSTIVNGVILYCVTAGYDASVTLKRVVMVKFPITTASITDVLAEILILQ